MGVKGEGSGECLPPCPSPHVLHNHSNRSVCCVYVVFFSFFFSHIIDIIMYVHKMQIKKNQKKIIYLIQDSDKLLNSSYPQFTDCFQNTLLIWVPCGLVWLALPFYLRFLFSNGDSVTLPLSFTNIAKTVSKCFC